MLTNFGYFAILTENMSKVKGRIIMADKSFWNEKKDKTWLKNFWFYYGKVVIISVCVLAIVICGIVSCARTVDHDLLVYYMGSEHLAPEVYENTGKSFVELIDDADGKHGKNAMCIDMVISDNNEQVTEMDMMMNTKVQIEMAEGDGYLYIMYNDDFRVRKIG